MSWDRSLIGRAGYYIRMVVNPQNPDDVFIMSSSMHRSQNGGKTFSGNGGGRRRSRSRRGRRAAATATTSGSIRRIPKRYVLTDDGGAESINTPGRLVSVRCRTAQMYHVRVDNRVPYWIYSNRQDDGTMRGPSTRPEMSGNGRLPEQHDAAPAAAAAGRRGGRGARRRAAGGGRARRVAAAPPWEPNIGGCESGFTIPDPDQRRHRLGELLRQQGDALGRAHAARRDRSSRG